MLSGHWRRQVGIKLEGVAQPKALKGRYKADVTTVTFLSPACQGWGWEIMKCRACVCIRVCVFTRVRLSHF